MNLSQSANSPEPNSGDNFITLYEHGIKWRDFARDPIPDVTPATIISSPLLDLMDYDDIIFESPRTKPVSGRTLRRLLDIGWVTEEEAKRDWQEMDHEALATYDAMLFKQPWKPAKAKRPSDEEREKGRRWRTRGLAKQRGRALLRPPGLMHRLKLSIIAAVAVSCYLVCR